MAWGQLGAPRGERGLCRGGITMHAVDRLPSKPGRLGDAGDASRAGVEHGSHVVELLAGVGRLAAEIGGAVCCLGVLDSSPLSGLHRFGLRLRGRSHERYQCVPHRFGDGVRCGAVERHCVDDGADDDTTSHELADGVANVVIVAAESVDPPHNERVTGPELVEQPTPFRALDEAGCDAADAVVRDYLVDDEAAAAVTNSR